MLKAKTNIVTRKAYICTKCEGVYIDDPVSECDCEVGQDQQFYVGTLIYEKFEV